jgi:ABC-type branched-subunit amino acid transport system substrate-binding protein
MKRLAIGLILVMVLLASCSSSKTSSSTTATTGSSSKLTGSPIVVYNFSPVNVAETASQPGVNEAMAAVTAYFNNRGGINGHPIKYLFCDDQESPTVTTQCADDAVSNHAVAMLNPYENVPNYLPILHNAGISILDALAIAPGAFTYSNSYVIDPGAFGQSFGAGDVLKPAGFKTVAFAESQLPGTAPVGDAFTAAAKSVGVNIKTIPVPGSLTDMSSIAAQVGSANAVYLLLPPNQVLAYMEAAKQQGVTAPIVADSGLLQQSQITETGGASSPAEGSIIATSFPDGSSPVWNNFKTAISQYTGAKSDIQVDNIADAASWVTMDIFVQVAKTITGTVTAQSFATALKGSTAVSTGGCTPTLNFSTPFPNSAWAQLYNTTAYFQTVTNGQFAVYNKVPSVNTQQNFQATPG